MSVTAAWRRSGRCLSPLPRSLRRPLPLLGRSHGRMRPFSSFPQTAPGGFKAFTVDEARTAVRERALETFHRWRRTHTAYLVTLGSLLGAGAMGIGLYFYFESYPSAIERIAVEKTVRAFAGALSFENRKKVYFGLPEATVPTLDSLISRAMEEVNTDADVTDEGFGPSAMKRWNDMVCSALGEVETNWLVMAKNAMREKLLEEALTLEGLDDRLDEIKELFPPSVERNILVSQQLDEELSAGRYIPAEIMEKNRPQLHEETCDIMTKLLINSIAFFPGKINELVNLLDGKRELSSLGEPMLAADHAIAKMKELYNDLSAEMKAYVLQTAVTTTISSLSSLPRVDGVEPYDLYVRAIDEGLIDPLRRDARITEDILDEVKNIFLAVPATVQARVLLTGIQHPAAALTFTESPEPKTETDRHDAQAEMVRDLLTAGGVVAVKLGQMLAEHPKMPVEYQTLLGSLREDNDAMRVTTFWWSIPSAVKLKIRALGRCLGTGSIKQVHSALFEDGQELAVAVLRAGVEDEALSSISALETSEEIGPVATRLGRLVFGEFDLFQEGEALQEFAQTPVGTHELFRVVEVRHHSPRCLVEEIAYGRSVASVLADPVDDAEVERTKEMLTEYHRAVFSAFVNDGLVHSDIHLGNAVKTDNGFILFDVGQFERIGLPDTKALLWTLGAVANEENRKTLRQVAIAHLSSVANLHEDTSAKKGHRKGRNKLGSSKQAPYSEDKPKQEEVKSRLSRAVTRHPKSAAKIKKELSARLDEAFAEAIKPDSSGQVPEPKVIYILFLRAAEKRGVDMPKGAFAVAKMIDCILSQQDQYLLFDVVNTNVAAFLRQNMTWGETADILTKKAMIFKNGSKI